MDNIAWLVPGLADGHGPRACVVSVAISLSCYLVTSRTIRISHRTAHL